MNFTIQGRAGQIGQREREGRIKTAGCGWGGGGFCHDFNCLFPGSQGVCHSAPFCIRQASVFAEFLQGLRV
ncbi:hypothetical protein ACQZ48_20535 [Agrobacterium sp. 22-209-1]